MRIAEKIHYNKKTEGAFLCMLFFLAGLLSFYKLSARNLWCDEIFNLMVGRQPLSSISLASVLPVPHPPLYFQLLHLVIRFGNGEFLLRLPSALFGTFSVILFYFFAKRISGRRAAALGAVLLALSPLRLWYSQEASPHIMAFCLGLAANLSFYLFLKDARPRNCLSWISFNLLSFYTTNHTLLLLPSQAILFFLCRDETAPAFRKRYILGLLLQALLYLPQAGNLMKGLFFLGEGFWIPPIGPKVLQYTLMNFLLGYNGEAVFYNLVFIIFCIMLIPLFFDRKMQELHRVFLALGLFPLSVLFLAHRLLPVYIDRHNLIFMPAFLLVFSSGLVWIRSRPARYAAILLSLAAAISALGNYNRDKLPLAERQVYTGVHIKKDVTALISYIDEDYRQGDMVAVTNLILIPLTYYTEGKKEISYFSAEHEPYWSRKMNYYKPRGYPFEGAVKGMVAAEPLSYRLVFLDSPVYTDTVLGMLPQRIWLLESSWARDGELEENSLKVEEVLKRRYSPARQKWMGGVRVSLYLKNGG